MAEARGHTPHHATRITFPDVLGDGFYAGAIGAAVVALFFLISDAIRHDPFYTPSLVGSVLFKGETPGPNVPVDLAMVALFSIVHGLAFVLFGLVYDFVLSRMKHTPDLPLIAISSFVLLEVGVVAIADALAPGLAPLIGYGSIGAANALAAVGMAVWLRRFALHLDDDPE